MYLNLLTTAKNRKLLTSAKHVWGMTHFNTYTLVHEPKPYPHPLRLKIEKTHNSKTAYVTKICFIPEYSPSHYLHGGSRTMKMAPLIS